MAHVTPHRLRHTLATTLINRGMPVTSLQAVLGHADLNTTQRYAHVLDPTVERDYRAVMHTLEHETGALRLAPVPIEALFADRALACSDRVTQPLDNSM